MDDFFGTNADAFVEKIRKQSVYRGLKSWKLVHLMIKTGDDIKQGTRVTMQNNSPCSS